MLIVFGGILAFVAFVILVRLLWLSARPSATSTLITLTAAALIVGLAILAATGRIHWLAAAAAAIAPFLRRGFGLLRHLPWIAAVLRRARPQQDGASGAGATPRQGTMSETQAREVLGLGTHPTREEVIAAHRRLIQKLHPDRGGTTFLAQQLNEAKRVLLQRR